MLKQLRRHVLVISQYFYPEQFRINDICVEWIKRGYEVTVVTGIPNYPYGKFYDGYGLFKKRKETYNGIQIFRLPIIPRGKNGLMLTINYISFVISGFFWNLFNSLKADCVFIYEVSPMTQALVGVLYSMKKKVPCYLYVTDLWPENVEAIAGVKNRYILHAIGKMVDYIYERCDKIFTSSQSFVEAIAGRGIPIDKIEFWPQYAEDYYQPINKKKITIPEIPNDGTFNIIFAGNIGMAQGLEILPKTAQLLKKNNARVRFNIVGDGRFKDKLIEMVNNYGVTDMFNFIPKQPSTRIPYFLAACDAAIICLSKNKVFSMTIPSKLQSYLACGIPIIASADGEVQKIITEARAGVCCNAGDAEMLACKINELISKSTEELAILSRNAYEYSKQHFNKETLLERMDVYLNY